VCGGGGGERVRDVQTYPSNPTPLAPQPLPGRPLWVEDFGDGAMCGGCRWERMMYA